LTIAEADAATTTKHIQSINKLGTFNKIYLGNTIYVAIVSPNLINYSSRGSLPLPLSKQAIRFRSVPTWLLKECAPLLVPKITNIVNLSLASGQFHLFSKICYLSSAQETDSR